VLYDICVVHAERLSILNKVFVPGLPDKDCLGKFWDGSVAFYDALIRCCWHLLDGASSSVNLSCLAFLPATAVGPTGPKVRFETPRCCCHHHSFGPPCTDWRVRKYGGFLEITTVFTLLWTDTLCHYSEGTFLRMYAMIYCCRGFGLGCAAVFRWLR
jgi:hypothetical protein